MQIIVNVVGDFITGSYGGKPFGITYSEDKYAAMLELQKKENEIEDLDELRALLSEFEALTQEDYSQLIETQSPYVKVNKKTNQFFLQFNNVVSSKAMPAILANKMIKAVEKNISIDPLVKCWARFLRNPFFSSKKAELFAEYISAAYVNEDSLADFVRNGVTAEVAKAMATTTQVAISNEGLLVVYKVSAEIREKYTLDEEEKTQMRSLYQKSIDPITGAITYAEPSSDEERYYMPAVMRNNGDPFYCIPGMTRPSENDKPGHILRIGCLITLASWDQVDTRDHVSGVKGLHVGGLNYIKGWQKEDTVTHNILVDPMHIGAIVGLGIGNDGAMRVKQYFVLSQFSGVNKNIYHSSKYAALTDQEYADMIKEAVDISNLDAKAAIKASVEREALQTIK